MTDEMITHPAGAAEGEIVTVRPEADVITR
jgi:hypothetical protein